MAIPQNALRPGSKWTALKPVDRSKHFEVLSVNKGDVVELKCVVTGVTLSLCRQDLEDSARWRKGWL